MSILPLAGLGVLVTRPDHQAAGLCGLLKARGAKVLRWRVVDIQANDTREVAAAMGEIDAIDIAIFASANAVKFGVALLEQNPDIDLAAIGPATARALKQAGHHVSVQPSGGFDSESLLDHPALEHLAGRRVLLVKGSKGRVLLEQELRRRGAQVIVADVYRRVPVLPSASELSALHEQLSAGAIQVITATSLEIAVNLLDVATPAVRRMFERVHWLLPGDRIAAGIRAQGLSAPLLRADSAEDQDLVEALTRWRASTSGA